MPAPTIVGTPVANRYGDLSVTVPGGANHLIAGAGFANGGVAQTETAAYNGDAMTAIAEANAGPDFSNQVLFGLVNPDIGTASLVTGPGGQANRAAMSLSGVAASSVYGTPASNTGTSTSPTVTITVGADALAVATIRFTGGGTTITAGTSETVRVQYTEDGGGIAILTKTGTGSVSFAPTLSASTGWQIVAVGVNGTPSAGPTITTQPTNGTVVLTDPTRASKTFTVAATGTGALSYAWEVDDGGGFDPVANGGIYSGATTASLLVTPTTETQDGYEYRAVVTDDNGSTTTDAATLTVRTGVALSAAGGTTNGSGVAAFTATSDVAQAAGEVVVVRATDGALVERTTLRFA